jgi:hypothetical protein
MQVIVLKKVNECSVILPFLFVLQKTLDSFLGFGSLEPLGRRILA